MISRRAFLPLLAAPAVLKLGTYMPISSAKLVVPPVTFTSTGPVAHYAAMGNREDLADLIYRIEPVDILRGAMTHLADECRWNMFTLTGDVLV